MKGLVIFASAAAFVSTIALAQQPALKLTVNRTRANDGSQMYASYCASCHGLDGRGHGPVATELKVPPTDLTLFKKAIRVYSQLSTSLLCSVLAPERRRMAARRCRFGGRS